MTTANDGNGDARDRSGDALTAYFGTQGVDEQLKVALRSVYISSHRDDELRSLLDNCLAKISVRRRDGTPFEGRGIAVLGESGAGKSHCVRRALSRHPIFSSTGVNGPDSMAVSVVCLGSCTLRILGESILTACGYDAEPGLRENEVWRLARLHLELQGALVVHIDEVINLIENANEADQQRVINNFKALINNPSWPVTLILSGIPSIKPSLKKDPQLRRRLHWIGLAPLTSSIDNATILSFSTTLCAKAALVISDDFESGVAARLIHAACHQLGLAAEMCIDAVEHAVRQQFGVIQDRSPAVAPTSL